LLASKRVSVLMEGNVVPLLPGHPVLDSTRSPWNGLYLEEHNLGAIPIPKHEHGTLVLHLQMNERVEMDWHSSGRSGHQVTGAGNVILLVPGTCDSLLFHEPSRRIVASIDPLLLK
jgi:AraC family transcriptional regulator